MRDRVLKVAKELNYKTSRSLSPQSANRLILVVGSMFNDEIVAGIQHEARKFGNECNKHMI